MKKIIVALALMIASITIEAQVKTPQPSPKATFTQVVGLTDVSVEYSRPSAKGRVVFGDLVPFGQLWRTGANANTTVNFSEDVVVNGATLKKGKYAVFTTPKADSWEVVFYSDTDNWGTPEKWEDSKVAAKTSVKTEALNRNVESFTVSINNLDNNFGHLEFSWEKTLVAVKFEVPTQKVAMASIEKTLNGPVAGDYFSSAQYFFQSNGDLNKSLEYVNKAIGMTKAGADVPFWYQRLKSLVQAKLNDKKGAIETAKLSLAGAEKAKNNDYIKMNNDSIKDWSKK
jgi:Protein of unknown function (DUF2911)